MKETNARQYALEILIDVDINNAYSNLAINKHLRDKEIEKIDKRLITELVYGVIENRIYLDFIIKTLSKIRMKKINNSVLNILRLGLYQIIFLDKIPAFAAVNETVKLAKKIDFRSVGFINGILRNYLRNKDLIKIPLLEDQPISSLSITYSHPEWLVEKWIEEFGLEDTEKLLKANNETPPLTVRTNTLATTKDELKKLLINENLGVSDGVYIKEALNIANAASIEELESFKMGYFQVQDESSMMVAHILDPKPGDTVIDVCAAPGGKTTHIAQLMKNQGKILARDIYDHKLKLIQQNAERLKINIIKTQCYNAKELDVDLIGKFDKVLVDAPCSGLGIIRRKPELKYNKKPDNIQEITELQLDILSNSSRYLKTGGTMVYSTCTITREENSMVVEKFLNNNKEFEAIDVCDNIPEPLIHTEKFLQLYPHKHGTDGFFISKLRKKL